MLPRVSADVVVVGGGVIGLAASVELASRGAQVVLVERGLPGAANSVLTGGGIRQQFSTATNIELAKLSAATWDDFEALYGVDPLFRRIGYLFLARGAAAAAELADHVALQQGFGVDSEYLDATTIEERWPSLRGRGFAGAGYRDRDGWANQHRVVDGLVRAALVAGVDLRSGTEALAIGLAGERVAGIDTTVGHIAADAILIATGAWGASLLAPLGVELPVVGRRHELLIVEPVRPMPKGLPWLISVEDEVHTRPDAPGRALVGGFLGSDKAVDPDSFSQRADASWSSAVISATERAFGVLGPTPVVRHGWAGLYPGTPDRHPIVDRLSDGLFVALGFAGTGLMMAPAAALLVGELIVEGAIRSIDSTQLRADRFATQMVSESTGF
jgi:sarcosine oxidase subunit beta